MFATIATVVLAAAMGAGDDPFYQPPVPLPSGMHGDLIRQRPLTDAAALPSAARNVLLLYRTQSLDGTPVAVSGTLAVPKGTPPPGGWPIVSWAHGTTGNAPRCTPSRDTAGEGIHLYLKMVDDSLDSLVAAGYAVVQTDYEGQGTPGVHPYLIGEPEGHDVIDIVRAARQAEPSLGTRYVVAGHSEGGFATLFAASLGPSWAPELSLLGAAAFAPASHLGLIVTFLQSYAQPLRGAEFGSLQIAAYAHFYPDVKPQTFLTPAAFAMLAQTQTRCVSDPAGFWATTPPIATFQAGANLAPLVSEAVKNDPDSLHVAVPVLLLQGADDQTVRPSITRDLRKKLCAAGTSIDLRSYPGVGHIGVVTPAMPDVKAWFDERFAGKPAASHCADV
jgi:alpha-beta hydrolase superfamily lysophospholipase